ncbi:hypothetical protein Sjap_003768 [Stephania japonica]|uniref:FAD-binding domain-containing protein n=1 Tax=Stephania japonica TaxID=461633 RepID=A0AAP0KQZ7_9MAGN
MDMESVEDIVIVGAGIAGLGTSLALHRLGLRSLVLEASDELRVTGFALTMWYNAWKALDALGVGDALRRKHLPLDGTVFSSSETGSTLSQISYQGKGKYGNRETRCVKRKVLLETLAEELPQGTIRFCSKVSSIAEDGYLKVLHLADGSIVKTKVLIGCDGVNSAVAKWLRLANLVSSGRSAIRGMAECRKPHDFPPKFLQFFGNGFRSGFIPCDGNNIYWFFTFPSTSPQYEDIRREASKMKRFVLDNLGEVPQQVVEVVENTDLHNIISSPLRLRWPWNVIWGENCKGNVCVAGDALHPMTPDLGQGGCSALEDSVILAKCLAEALLVGTQSINSKYEEDEYGKIKRGLEKFVKERKWRGFALVATAYVLGMTQQSNGTVMKFARDKLLSAYLAGLVPKMADYDCGNLN